MKTKSIVLFIACLFFVITGFLGCESTGSSPSASAKASSSIASPSAKPSPTAEANTDEGKIPVASGNSSGAGFEQDLASMQKLYDNAFIAIDNNHPTEAIKNFVSILSYYDGMGGKGSAAASDLAKKAEVELNKIGSKLSLEPGSEWLDEKGNQISGSTRALVQGTSIQPIVYLFANFGYGKAAVNDAPISFQIISGGGTIVNRVATDAEGRANTTISKVEKPSEQLIVRAMPVFVVRGFTYIFKSVYRDFVYVPPQNTATIIVMEKTPTGYRANSQTTDQVYNQLKSLNMDFVPYDGSLAGSEFEKAYQGDKAALAALAKSLKVSYFVFVYSEASAAIQYEYDGVKYNIFTTTVTTTLRFIRSDGTILVTLPMPVANGKGGSAEVAYTNVFKLASDALVEELKKSAIQKQIKEALAK